MNVLKTLKLVCNNVQSCSFLNTEQQVEVAKSYWGMLLFQAAKIASPEFSESQLNTKKKDSPHNPAFIFCIYV